MAEEIEEFDFHLPKWFSREYHGPRRMEHAANIAAIMAKNLAAPEQADEIGAALLGATQRRFAQTGEPWPQGAFEPVLRVVLAPDGEIYLEGQIVIGGKVIEDGRFGHLRIVFCEMDKTH